MDFKSVFKSVGDFLQGGPPKPPTIDMDILGGEKPFAGPEELRQGRAICTGDNHAELLMNGDEALPALMAAIRNAKHHIHIQSMVFTEDEIGHTIHRALCRKAQEGVKVRVLFEFLTSALDCKLKGMSSRTVHHMVKEMEEAGVEVRDAGFFSPELLDSVESNMFLRELRRAASIERKIVSNDRVSALIALQEKYIGKAESVLLSPTLEKIMKTGRSLIVDKIPGLSNLLNPGHYFRQFMLKDHRKIAVFDGQVGFCGGMNIGREYFYWRPYREELSTEEECALSDNPEPWAKWRDACTRVRGPAVNRLQRLFVERWWEVGKAADTSEIANEDKSYFPEPEEAGNAAIWVLTQTSGGDREISHRLLQEMLRAKESVRVSNPYLSNEDFIAALVHCGKQGLDVELMLSDDHNDVILHQVVMRGCYDWYEKAGVKGYEYQGHFTHAKVATFDDKLVHIGSFNFNNRSTLLDMECSLLIEDVDFAKEVRKRVFQDPVSAGTVKAISDVDESWRDLDTRMGAKAIYQMMPDIF